MGLTTQDTTALVDLDDEIKPYLDIAPDREEHDSLLSLIGNWVTAQVEAVIDRKVVTRGTITEYHTLRALSPVLHTLQYPIISVTTIHEDPERSYGAAELLTESDDYIVTKPEGKIARVYSTGSGLRNWELGYRAVKIVYTAGYATTATVPDDLKLAAMRAIALVYREITRREQGVSSVSDDMGNVSRLFPAGLTPGIRMELARFKRYAGFGETGEVDA